MNYGKYTAIVTDRKLVILERGDGPLAKTIYQGEFRTQGEAIAHIDKVLADKPGSVSRIVN